MTREQLLEQALKAMLRSASRAVYAEDRYHYWTQFGTASTRERNATARREAARDELERAEDMARAALRGNVTEFEEAACRANSSR